MTRGWQPLLEVVLVEATLTIVGGGVVSISGSDAVGNGVSVGVSVGGMGVAVGMA